MATQVSIGEYKFIVLDEIELGCDHDFRDYHEHFCINSHREYVIGYGTQPVSVQVKVGAKCLKCGRLMRFREFPELARKPIKLTQENLDEVRMWQHDLHGNDSEDQRSNIAPWQGALGCLRHLLSVCELSLVALLHRRKKTLP